MPNPRDYSDLTSVKKFIAPTLVSNNNTTNDVLLGQMITAVSQEIDKYLSRVLMAQTYTEVRHGNERNSMRTKQYPIIAVQSVTINGQNVNAAVGPIASGYLFDDKFIYLRGNIPGGGGGLFASTRFMRGVKNVQIKYTAGYLTPGQLAIQNLPGWVAGTHYLSGSSILVSNYIYTCTAPGISGTSSPTFPTALGALVTDNNVTWQNAGAWLAPPADAEELPEQLNTACAMHVAYIYSTRARMGDTSTGEGQQRVTYMVKDMHPATRMMVDSFRAVVPIGDYS